MSGEPSQEPLRVAASRVQAEEWALVLASAGIPSRLQKTNKGCVLLVPALDAARATRVLEAYDEETHQQRAVPTAAPEYGRTRVALAVAVLLIAFYLVSGASHGAAFWVHSGSASAARILDGELWRTVTALTLHADLVHVLSNAVTWAIFGTAVCQAVGPGIGLWLVLLSGAGGNLLNAAFRGSHHSAIGASTAVFGAVGILAAIQVTRRRHGGATTWRSWAPLGAALALLAFLGTGSNADILAHLFGFFAGGLLGFATMRIIPRPPAAGVQIKLVIAAGMTVIMCWLLALR